MEMDRRMDPVKFLPPEASDTLHIMAQAASLAGQGLLQAADRLSSLKITEKTTGDFVSDADMMAEKTISNHLMQRYPDYGWLGEETGTKPGRSSGLRWIVDPLDGTVNFLKGLPHWAVSIALCDGETPLAAIVFDPAKRELFSAERGGGAYLNGNPIAVSRDVPLSSALMATGLPAGGRITYLPHSLQDLNATMPHTAGLRRWGAAALDLAYVAAGRFDCYWERNLGPWDIAAGILLVQEAGGRVTPLWSDRSILSSGSFLASNGALHNAVEAHLNLDQ
jgi:myo-inositol-1(or 4)-monophosphatase